MRLSPPPALRDMLQSSLAGLAQEEHIATADIERAVEQGTMVLLANPAHPGVKPILIGRPAHIKVNANLGTSPLLNDLDVERAKLAEATHRGAHTVMDLSTAGDLDAIRKEMLETCPLPLGTVPLYGVAQKYIAAGKDPAFFDGVELIDEIEKQAEQGVDFMTLHMGVTERAAAMAQGDKRILGIVSRGGSITARWMRRNKQENPLLTHMDRVLDICRKHNVVISMGDGLRPGSGADAGDAAQWEEVIILGQLTLQAWEAGVQVMIEGPGHVPLHLVESQIRGIKQLCHGAPLYVLGPLTTDAAPGYDHISGAIGGAMAGYFGADYLCYLTPAEHLTLPSIEDVRQGVMASLIAARSAEKALGDKRATQADLDISIARKNLDWEGMAELSLDPDMVRERRADFPKEKECAMCGKFCAIRMGEEDL
jgi:phosphomethylpyrimidine synthase